MGITSKSTAAYLAGLLDGEGWIGVSKVSDYAHSRTRKGYFFKANIAIANTYKPLIDWLQKSFGGTVREDNRGNRKRTLYQWGSQNPEYITEFLRTILPYLRIKREQALNLIEFCKTFDKKNYSVEQRTNENSKWKIARVLSPAIWEKREVLYEKSKRLNHSPCSLRD